MTKHLLTSLSLLLFERPTLDRHADFYIHTLCYYLVFPGNVYRDLYNKRGKIPERKRAMVDQNYEGRLIPTSDMRTAGMYGDPDRSGFL